VAARLVLTNDTHLIAKGRYAEIVERLELGGRWMRIEALQQDGQVRTTHVNPAHVVYAEIWNEEDGGQSVFVE
jgi:hypothetical protein